LAENSAGRDRVGACSAVFIYRTCCNSVAVIRQHGRERVARMGPNKEIRIQIRWARTQELGCIQRVDAVDGSIVFK